MIQYYNRQINNYEIEKVAGEKYLSWTYSSPVGMSLLEAVLKKKLFSKLYGMHCDSNSSKKKIQGFIESLDIDMSSCESKTQDFKCFNDFFIRKLKPEARPFEVDENAFISPGDGRLFAYENIDLNNLIQVKGITYSLIDLIQDNLTASKFNDGICLILRLCPTDYHRFHFVDNGTCDNTIKIKGSYYSVNPIALEKIPKVFCKNKREWSIFHSDNFGDILYIEVGATCVGTIVQSYDSDEQISKGDEKGYFKFGGSTVVLFLEKGKVKIDEEIIKQTSLGYETKVLMGEKIGTKL
jgi:phosphatidylserine decarboxylase